MFLANRVDQQTGAQSFASFEREYWLPARYLEGGPAGDRTPEPTWVRIWKARSSRSRPSCCSSRSPRRLCVRDTLVRRATRKDKRWVESPAILIWVTQHGDSSASIALAAPSITHVLTWFHAVVFQWRWELFLSDPSSSSSGGSSSSRCSSGDGPVLRVALSLWRARRSLRTRWQAQSA